MSANIQNTKLTPACDTVDISTVEFASRQESWVATNGNKFLKIPKRPGGPDDAMSGGDSDEAAKQFHFATWLARIESQVLPPEALHEKYACLVFRYLSGEDLADELRREQDPNRARAATSEAIRVCARLHANAGLNETIGKYDYENDPFYPLADAELLRLGPTSIVIHGLEVRNFRRDGLSGKLQFFDLHDIWWGMPEEDVTRFVISLLMLRWGRRTVPRPWTRIDLASICETYEKASGISLNSRRLQYCTELNFRMREQNATRAARLLPQPWRIAARAYMKIYFSRMRDWIYHHGI